MKSSALYINVVTLIVNININTFSTASYTVSNIFKKINDITRLKLSPCHKIYQYSLPFSLMRVLSFSRHSVFKFRFKINSLLGLLIMCFEFCQSSLLVFFSLSHFFTLVEFFSLSSLCCWKSNTSSIWHETIFHT